jgi:tripartite-type tricarboxylate transporter receptor subunit TctC
MAAGQLKPIAVSTRDRVPGYDKIAPVAETFPDFDFSGWMSVAAPLKTPLDVVEKINRAMDATLKEPEVKSKLAEIGFFTQGAGTLADIQQYVQGQYDAFGKIIQAIGLQPE